MNIAVPSARAHFAAWSSCIGGILAILGASLAPAHAQSSDWDKVVAAAKAEGKLTIYNGSNFRIVRAMASGFQNEYGIATDVLDGRTTEIRERIRTEQAAGRNIGDILYTGNTTMALQYADGVFQEHGPIPNAKNLGPTLGANGSVLPISVGNFAVLINTNLIKPNQEPRSWLDLTDPKWKGKILSDDPRAAGAGEVWFETTLGKFGRAFHEKMAAQNPVFSRVYNESHMRLARGEYPIYLPFNVSEFKSLKGLPVKVLVPEEGVPFLEFSLALLKGAPHPNAARLFMNYTLTPEIQLAIAAEGLRPTVKGMESRLSTEVGALVHIKGLATTAPGRTDEFLKLAKEIYK